MNANELNYRRNPGTLGFTNQEVLEALTDDVKAIVRNNGVAIVLAAMATAVKENGEVAAERIADVPQNAEEASTGYAAMADALEGFAKEASRLYGVSGW